MCVYRERWAGTWYVVASTRTPTQQQCRVWVSTVSQHTCRLQLSSTHSCCGPVSPTSSSRSKCLTRFISRRCVSLRMAPWRWSSSLSSPEHSLRASMRALSTTRGPSLQIAGFPRISFLSLRSGGTSLRMQQRLSSITDIWYVMVRSSICISNRFCFLFRDRQPTMLLTLYSLCRVSWQSQVCWPCALCAGGYLWRLAHC